MLSSLTLQMPMKVARSATEIATSVFNFLDLPASAASLLSFFSPSSSRYCSGSGSMFASSLYQRFVSSLYSIISSQSEIQSLRLLLRSQRQLGGQETMLLRHCCLRPLEDVGDELLAIG